MGLGRFLSWKPPIIVSDSCSMNGPEFGSSDMGPVDTRRIINKPISPDLLDVMLDTLLQKINSGMLPGIFHCKGQVRFLRNAAILPDWMHRLLSFFVSFGRVGGCGDFWVLA